MDAADDEVKILFAFDADTQDDEDVNLRNIEKIIYKLFEFVMFLMVFDVKCVFYFNFEWHT